MATDKEFIVNKKFVIIFVAIQFIGLVATAFVLLSPKTVTVHIEKIDKSFQIERPLEIVVPVLNR